MLGAARYRGTVETQGASLDELPESAEVSKATSDSCDRPLVRPDGSATPLTAAALEGVARGRGADDGRGRGFQGHRAFEGAGLAALLTSKLPAGTDPGLLFVGVTASAGDRALTSGGQILPAR